MISGAGTECAPGEPVGELTDERAEAVSALGSSSELPETATRKLVRVRLKFAPEAPEVRPAESTPMQRPAEDAAPTADRLVEAFRLMALIRRYEEHLYQLFLQGTVPGTLHQCQGQEAVAVGVCSALRRDDVIYSTHRPVGHMIAKGASLNAITAEIWGKATGCAGGKGGQMHLADFSVGAMVSNAIVGANIPIATGSAIGFRLQGLDRIAVSFFGDGASNIGAFHEGLNLAAVQRAPVVFVCENNLYARFDACLDDDADRRHRQPRGGLRHARSIHRRHGRRGGFTAPPRRRLSGRGAAAARPSSNARPTAIAAIRGAIRAATASAEEHRQWTARDPIERMRGRAHRRFRHYKRRAYRRSNASSRQMVEAAVAFALASPDPTPASARDARLCSVSCNP